MDEQIYAAIDLKSFYASVECVERGLDPMDANLVVADASRTDKTICLAVSSALKLFGIPGRIRLFEVIAIVNRLNKTRVKGFKNEGIREIHRYNAIYSDSLVEDEKLKKANSEKSGEECKAKNRKAKLEDERVIRKSDVGTMVGENRIVEKSRQKSCELEEIIRSMSLKELNKDISRKINFIIATPRMGLYVDYSMRIYDIYLRYISPEDIFAYSIDEVFISLTPYLKIYRLSPKELVRKILLEVYYETGITATAGIGTNLYLAKVAMDVVAKHSEADENGTRIAFLDTYKFRSTLWEHLPLTDFWGIGRGTAKKLNEHGLYTVGDIARCSLGEEKAYYNVGLLYRLFGVNAELLIDHAWGIEPVTLKEVKNYIPRTKSVSSSQILTEPYTYEMARIVLMEMVEKTALGLMEKGDTTSQMAISIGYDVSNIEAGFQGEMAVDRYGRMEPKRSQGSIHIDPPTNLASSLIEKAVQLYDKIADSGLWIRRISIAATKLNKVGKDSGIAFQMHFDMEEKGQKECEKREENLQKAILQIKKKYGKNAILRGYSFQEGATARSRNKQIGGHKE